MDRRTLLSGAAGLLLASGLSGGARAATPSAAARRLYRDAIVIDGNLVPPLDADGPLDAALSKQVRASGLTAFKLTRGGSGSQSKAATDEELAITDKALAHSNHLFSRIRSVEDIRAAKKNGRVGIIFSFEAGEMLEGQVDNIDHFRRQDVLVMGLSYNLATPFASGVMVPKSTGLTELGRQAVERMNALGVTLDISHSDERSSLSAIAASARPALITHAGCAAIRPHPRNKSDRLLRALSERGGVMGVYDLSYLSVAPEQPSLAAYLGHLTHALKVCGEDHVGIGSDTILTGFDTSPESMKGWDAETARRQATGVAAPGEGPPPFVTGLNRPDRGAIIADGLLKAGYPARVAEKVMGANFLRVFQETWRA
ncbi:MAG: Zn-dependent dipeptidase [Caulobacteraceae bacterium]|nr:MAG: Zn-dependent dipeptidase [Caulobacteraceae bacterium]